MTKDNLDSFENRYARHINLKEIGVDGQKKLLDSKVLCIGAGGLGSPALLYLVAAGIGTIGVIDHDTVDLSNLQRQVIFNNNDLNKPKVKVAKNKILALNPNIKVDIYNSKFNIKIAEDIISKYNIILDCTDNFTAHYLVNDVCQKLSKPYVYASIYKFEGMLSFFTGNKKDACLRCLYPEIPGDLVIPNCQDTGVLGVLPGLFGVLQATEAIKYILNIGDNLVNKIYTHNILDNSINIVNFKKNSECFCSKSNIKINEKYYKDMEKFKDSNEITYNDFTDLLNNNKELVVIDVREAFEHNNYNIGGINVPLSELANQIDILYKDYKNKTIVIYCQKGIRSLAAVKIFKDKSFKEVYSLQNGIASL